MRADLIAYALDLVDDTNEEEPKTHTKKQSTDMKSLTGLKPWIMKLILCIKTKLGNYLFYPQSQDSALQMDAQEEIGRGR